MMRIKRSQNAQTTVDMDTVDGHHASDFVSRTGDTIEGTLHTVSSAPLNDAFVVNSGAVARMQASIDGGATWKNVPCSGQPVPGLAGKDMTGKTLLLKEVLSTVFPGVAPRINTCSVEVDGTAGTVGNYAYVKTHTIAGSADGDLSDYQVKINVHYWDGTDGTPDASHVYLGGHTLSWPNDVRFTNNSDAPLDFWIESCSGDLAVFWVKVDSIPSATGATIKMYYGHAEDSGASDGEATFELFDDFSDLVLDDTKWNAGLRSPTVSITNGKLSVSGELASVQTFATGAFMARYSITSSNNAGLYAKFNTTDNTMYLFRMSGCDGTNTVRIYSGASWVQLLQETYALPDWSAPHVHTAYFDGVNLWMDLDHGAITSKVADTTLSGAASVALVTHAGAISVDWAAVRKLTPHEPAQEAWGVEARYNSAIRREITHSDMDNGSMNHIIVEQDAVVSDADTTAVDFATGTLSNVVPRPDSYSNYYTHSDISTANFNEAVRQSVNTAGDQIRIQAGTTNETKLTENTQTLWNAGTFNPVGLTAAADNALKVNIPSYLTGTRYSPDITLPAGGGVQSSTISWSQVLNGGTVVVEAKVGSGSWQACTSGSAIPGLSVDSACAGRVIQIRQTLTAPNTSATPTMSNLVTTIITASYPATGIWTSKLNSVVRGDVSNQLSGGVYLNNLSADNTDDYDLYWNLQNKQEVSGDDYGQLSNFVVSGMTTGNTDTYKLYWDLTTINSESYGHTDTSAADFDAGTKSGVTTSGDAIVLADGWATGYKYRKSHVITSTGTALTNYQMKFTIYKDNGVDGNGTVYLNGYAQSWTGTVPNDIRFTNAAGTLLDYYIESSTAYEATVWVEIDSIPASGGATIYLYYGKAGDTSASNGTNTFLFFDNFDSGSFDAGKWTVTGSPTIVADTSYPGATKAAVITPGNAIAGVKVDAHSYITEWYMKFNSFGSYGPRWNGVLKEDNANSVNNYALCVESREDGSIDQFSGWKRTCMTENGSAITANVAASWNTGFWYFGRYTTSAGSQKLEIDGATLTSSDATGDAWYARFTTSTWDSGSNIRIFRVWTRNYATTEPGHASGWGAQTNYVPSSGTWVSPSDTTSPSGTVTWSRISWSAYTPANTGVGVEAKVGAGSWQACTNGGAIPGFTTSPSDVQIRATLSSSDNMATPTLYEIVQEATLTTYAGTYYVKLYKDAGMTQQVAEGSRATYSGPVTLSQINSSGLSGSVNIVDTRGDTGTITTMNPTLDVYSDSAKTHLVSMGRLSCATSGTVTMVPQNNSGIGGDAVIAYTTSDTDAANVLSPGNCYVIVPEGGEVTSSTITWRSNLYPSTSINVHVSLDGGVTWEPVLDKDPIPGLLGRSGVIPVIVMATFNGDTNTTPCISEITQYATISANQQDDYLELASASTYTAYNQNTNFATNSGVQTTFSRTGAAYDPQGASQASGAARYKLTNLCKDVNFAQFHTWPGNVTSTANDIFRRVTRVSTDVEWLCDAVVSVRPSTKYTASFVFRHDGVIPSIYLSFCSYQTGHHRVPCSFKDLGAGITFASATYTTDSSTIQLRLPDFFINGTWTWFEFGKFQLEEGALATTYNTGYGGLLIEEAATNTVYHPFMDVTTNYGTNGGTAVVNTDTTYIKYGTTSMHITSTAQYQGLYQAWTAMSGMATTHKYTASVYLYVVSGTYYLNAENGTMYNNASTSGTGWQKLEITFLLNSTGGALTLYCSSATAEAYVNYFQVEEKLGATSPISGTRNAEYLTLPAYTNVFNRAHGTVEFWFRPSEFKPNDYSRLFSAGYWTSGSTVDNLAVYYNGSSGNTRTYPSYIAADLRDSVSHTSVYDSNGGNPRVTLSHAIDNNAWYYCALRWNLNGSDGELRISLRDTDGHVYHNSVTGIAATPQFSGLSDIYFGAESTGCEANAYFKDIRLSDIFRTDAEVETAADPLAPFSLDSNTMAYIPCYGGTPTNLCGTYASNVVTTSTQVKMPGGAADNTQRVEDTQGEFQTGSLSNLDVPGNYIQVHYGTGLWSNNISSTQGADAMATTYIGCDAYSTIEFDWGAGNWSYWRGQFFFGCDSGGNGMGVVFQSTNLGGSGIGNSSGWSTSGTESVNDYVGGCHVKISMNGTQATWWAGGTHKGTISLNYKGGYIGIKVNNGGHSFSISNVMMYKTDKTGIRYSPDWACPANSNYVAAGSTISWTRALNGCSEPVVETSINGGSTWQAVTNGGAINPNLTNGQSLNGITIKCRQTLVHNDPSGSPLTIATPTLSSLALSLNYSAPYPSSAQWQSAAMTIPIETTISGATISWTEATQGQGSSTYSVQTSVNGSSYYTVTNGGNIPGLLGLRETPVVNVLINMASSDNNATKVISNNAIVITCSGYASSGYRISPPVDLSNIAAVESSDVSWSASTPNGTNFAVYASTDGGRTWEQCANNAAVPGLLNGTVPPKSLLIKSSLTSSDVTETPILYDISVGVIGNGAVTLSKWGTDYSATLSSTDDFTANKITNPSFTRASTGYDFIGRSYASQAPRFNSLTGSDARVWYDDFSSDTSSRYTVTNITGIIDYVIANGKLSMNTLAYTGVATYGTVSTITSHPADVYVETATDTCEWGGPVARRTSAGFYLCCVGDSGNSNIMRLYKNVSGSFTQLTQVSISFTRGTMHRIGLRVFGSIIQGYFDGVCVTSATDTAVTGSGGCGLYLDMSHAANTSFQDLKVSRVVKSLLIEEATTNLLTANQASPTDATGWPNTGAATITADTANVVIGTKSIKVVTNGAGPYEGITTSDVKAVSPNTYYTISAWLSGSGSVAMNWWEYNSGAYTQNGTHIPITLTSTPTRYTMTSKTGASSNQLRPWITTLDPGAAITFYASGLQLEQKPFATSWFTGAGTRAADTVTIPALNILDTNSGTIECRVYVNAAIKDTSADRYIFAHRYSDDVKNIIALKHSTSGSWTAWTSDISGRTTTISAADTLTIGWHHFALRWSLGRLSLSIDGAEVAYSKDPYLPMLLSTYVAVGYWPGGSGSGWINTDIKDIRVNSGYKSDASLLNAYIGGMPLDSDPGNIYLAKLDGDMISSMATNGVTISDNNVSLITSNNVYTNVHNTTADFNRGTVSNVVTGSNSMSLLGNLNYSYYKTLNITGGSSAVSNYQLNLTLNNANCVYATYAHSKQHTINGSADGTLSNYQVKVVVHKGSGVDGQPDASHVYLNSGAQSWTGTVPNDIRFASGTTGLPLDYWIESSDSSTATVWVEVDLIPATGTTFYICYGKSSETSASNADATMLLYDNFATGNSAKWSWSGNGSCAYANNEVELMSGAVGSNSTLTSTMNLPNGISATFSYRSYYNHSGSGSGPGDELIWAMFGPYGRDWSVGPHRNTWSSGDDNDLTRMYTGNLSTLVYQDNAGVPEGTYGGAAAWSSYETCEVRVSNSAITMFKNGSQVYTGAWTPASDQSFKISVEGHDSWDRQWLYLGVNLLKIRKYTQNEPTHGAWGTDAAPTFYTADGNGIVYTYGNAQADWDDIRFFAADNATPLPYYIESTTTSSYGNTANIFVKVPYIPTGPATATIYIYYGNAAVGPGNDPWNTFDFYDNFNDYNVDSSRWTISNCQEGGSVGESGTLNVSGNGEFTQARVTSKVNSTMNYPAILEYRIYTHSGNSAYYNRYFWPDLNEFPNCGAGACGSCWSNETTFNGARINLNFPYDQWMNSMHYFIPNAYHRWVFSKADGSTFYNGTGVTDLAGGSGNNMNIVFSIGTGNAYPGSWGGNMNVDWIRVRKWMSGSLPMVTSSGAQTATSSGTWVSDVYNISALGVISTSSVSWTFNAPNNTTVTIYSSFDGVNWTQCTNGSQVPTMTAGFNCSGKYLYLKAVLTGNQTYGSATISSITVSITPTNTVSGSWISAPLDISSVEYVADSTVTWNCNVPKGSSLVVSSSLNGAEWQVCDNGGTIPGLAPGLNVQAASLRFKAYLVGNGIIAPSLFDLSMSVTSAYVVSGYRILPPISLTGLGTITNSAVYWTSTPPMGHVGMDGDASGTDISIKTNCNGSGVLDDVSVPSWKLSMGSHTDAFEVSRAAPNSSDFASMIKVDANGKVTSCGEAVGTRSATKYVTASNARYTSIADGDYHCDGGADEATINAAITGLPTSGGTVVLSDGTFYLSGSVVLPSNVTLRGAGFTATYLNIIAYDSYPAIANSDPTNGNAGICISDLGINTAANAAAPASISMTKVSRLTIDNVDIAGSPGNGIYMYNCATTQLSNICVHGCTKYGIVLAGASARGSITSSVVYSNTLAGISVENASSIKISGNTFYSNGLPGAVFVNNYSTSISVNDNAMYNNSRNVVMFGSYSTISGNTMAASTGGTNIWLSGCTGCIVSNNVLVGSSTGGITSSAGYPAKACSITGNIVYGASVTGIYGGDFDECSISGNIVYASGQRGIFLDSASARNLIANNVASANSAGTASTYENILINAATGSTVVGNHTYKGASGNLSGWALSMSGGDSTAIGNDFNLGGATGIVWTDGNGTTLQGLPASTNLNRVS